MWYATTRTFGKHTYVQTARISPVVERHDSTMQVLTMLLVLSVCLYAGVNAASPVFVNPPPTGGSGSIAENVGGGTWILSLVADDADGDTPIFSIVSQTPSTPAFKINQFDQLEVPVEGIDYETTKAFYFDFQVTDGSTAAVAHYNLTITNVDDESPVFEETLYSMSISDLAQTGTSVLQVRAIDADSSRITYSISGSQTMFGIDPVTGVITVKDSGQLTTQSGSLVQLTIEARDEANHASTTNAYITITESPCRRDPCKNGGTCTVEGNSFKCKCLPGYLGTQCEAVDYCFLSPCQNNGKCKTLDADYKCECGLCFTDKNCSTPSNPCGKNGLCSGGMCNCHAGFDGDRCEKKVNPCLSDPCKNGGTCTVEENSFKCKCLPKYFGIHCEADVLKRISKERNGTHSWIIKMELIVNRCRSDPCQNGGTCTVKGNSFKCKCVPGYTGTQCKAVDYCFKNPCQNNRQCKNIAPDYSCICGRYFTDKNCSTPKCHLTYTPCTNGKLNVTFGNNPAIRNTNEACTNKNKTVDCISKKIKSKDSCDVIEIVNDYTPCAAGNTTFYTTKTPMGKACSNYVKKRIEKNCDSLVVVNIKKGRR